MRTRGKLDRPWKVVRVFVNNELDKWAVVTGQWGAPALAYFSIDDKIGAERLADEANAKAAGRA